MSRKSITLAIAAAVSLGAVALSSSTAFAYHPSGGGVKYSGVKSSGGFQSNPHIVTGLHVNNKPQVMGVKINPQVQGIKINPKVTGILINPKFNHWPRHWWWRYSFQRPYWVAPVIATGAVAAYAATTPTTNRCTCLTKEYTPQGAVVFKDVCTNEMAMNPPVNASPAAYMPQQPQQQGYLQPQSQPQVQ
jgi:hypothetical protein